MSDKLPLTFMQQVQRDAMVKLLRTGGKMFAAEICGWTVHRVDRFIEDFRILPHEMGGFRPTQLPHSEKLRAGALKRHRKEQHDVDAI